MLISRKTIVEVCAMLEPTSTCIHKSIFHIIKNPEFSSDTDIQERRQH